MWETILGVALFCSFLLHLIRSVNGRANDEYIEQLENECIQKQNIIDIYEKNRK
jgi:hypothetical protein